MSRLTENGFAAKSVKVIDPETGEPKRNKHGKLVYQFGTTRNHLRGEMEVCHMPLSGEARAGRLRPIRRFGAKPRKNFVDDQAASPSSWKTPRMAVWMAA